VHNKYNDLLNIAGFPDLQKSIALEKLEEAEREAKLEIAQNK
jgi:hypothetical protein